MAGFTWELPAPRILRVALGAGADGLLVRRTVLDTAPGATLRLGGAALAVHLTGREDRDDAGAAASALVLAVGAAVRRGLPTAARLTVAGRSPLTGGYSEGQVGGELAAALAGHADALVLTGRAAVGANLLVLGADGELRLERRPELAGLAPERVGAVLADSGAGGVSFALERAGLLAIGPAGEAGVRFAGLCSGWSEPSFTGRGGLGARFGGLGLKALVVEPAHDAESVELRELDPRAGELAALLAGSPRLAQRAASGTLELLHAFSARGDLRARNYRDVLEPAAGSALEREARTLARGRHGCRRCPTPCGLVFERQADSDVDRAIPSRSRARFGAIYALGPNLGLEHFDAALQLHALCDAAGMDAREVGAVLALTARARELGRLPGPPLFGDREALAALLGELARGTGAGALLAAGAVRLAEQLGLEAELIAARGQAARPERRPAAVLGQCVATAGSDPVRAFPFLSEAGVRLAGVVGLEALPSGAEDPETPTGKGLLVWWHENLAAALDSLGFCAFSAGGLLADGLSGLEQLAALLLGGAGESAELLLAHGAAVVLARRELEARWDREEPSPAAWAAAELAHPELLPAYRAARGPYGEEPVTDLAEAPERAWARPCEVAQRGAGAESAGSGSGDGWSCAVEQRPGHVELRAAGALADRLGSPATVRLRLPASAGEVLAEAGRAFPAARVLLWREEQLLPLVYREGLRLEAGAAVRDGECLDLVLTVAGG